MPRRSEGKKLTLSPKTIIQSGGSSQRRLEAIERNASSRSWVRWLLTLQLSAARSASARRPHDHPLVHEPKSRSRRLHFPRLLPRFVQGAAVRHSFCRSEAQAGAMLIDVKNDYSVGSGIFRAELQPRRRPHCGHASYSKVTALPLAVTAIKRQNRVHSSGYSPKSVRARCRPGPGINAP